MGKQDSCCLDGSQPLIFAREYPKSEFGSLSEKILGEVSAIFENSPVPPRTRISYTRSWEEIPSLEKLESVFVWFSKVNDENHGFCTVRADIVPPGMMVCTPEFKEKILATAFFTRKILK